MTLRDTRESLVRMEAALARAPEAGRHADAPATARWAPETLRMVASHPNGCSVETDMPGRFGGCDDALTPGWLFRAGLASCAATSIVLAATVDGLALSEIEVRADSESDTRGLLGMRDGDGRRVDASSTDVKLHVRLRAAGVAPERLRALVREGLSRSPIPGCVGKGSPIAITVDAGE